MAKALKSAADAHAAANQNEPRAVHTFTVPKHLGGKLEKVSLVEINTGEELMAVARARQDPLLLGFSLAQQALYAVKYADKEPQRVSTGDGSAEAAYAAMPAKVRQLVLTAYTRLHNPVEDDQKDFLDSVETDIL